MDYSAHQIKIQSETGRWFVVVSQVDGGYLARDLTTSDLVYMKECDITCREEPAGR
jgi:hypothetical protein